MAELIPQYPKTLFRFRPYTPLSLKELQYGEIFFVSKEELNDPYDTKNPACFEPDIEIYKRLIFWLLSETGVGNLVQTKDVEEIASFLAKRALLQDELLDIIVASEFEAMVKKAFRKIMLEEIASIFILRFRQTILNGGGLCYIASFSKINNDPVMWSHYANRHKGFCLCFSAEDGTLQRDRMFEKGQFFHECKFEEVSYESNNVTTNGYMMFPKYVYGKEVTEEERKNYWNLRRKAYLTKYTSWSYEQEVRVLVDDWFDVRSSANGIVKKTIAERIFYYDQRQLTGLVFGTQMTFIEREEVRTIINIARRKLLLRDNVFFNGRSSGSYLPIFLFYQAVENVNDFKMRIEPIDGLDANSNYFTVDKLDAKKTELNNLKELFRKQDEYRKSKNLQGPIGVNGAFLTPNE